MNRWPGVHWRQPGAARRKSTRSPDQDIAVCAEIAVVGDGHAVRDSTDPHGAVHALDPGVLKRLMDAVPNRPSPPRTGPGSLSRLR
ncbi:DUF397 domain-containing protein [Actinomadura sp. 6K520]|uniref:DUF397 domain-containing protein n=1 Tax=Actinomadura sp. 6K520 TaxID=2530364 RepID=UPI0014044B0B|nr:DUF397 domain-containing protein [Actinomadura sp. 6K520]